MTNNTTKTLQLWCVFVMIVIICGSTSCKDDPELIASVPANKKIDLSTSEGQDLSSTDYNILFVGNSLTIYNDLPGLVMVLGDQSEVNLGVRSVTTGGYTLERHWNNGVVQKEIATGLFDYVVIQEASWASLEYRANLIKYSKKIKEVCDQHEAKLAFYMVWPSISNYHRFNEVISNYRDAARVNNAILCPVGVAWKEYIDATGDFSYYDPDGNHPSLAGSRVAAEVIYESLFED